MKEEDNQNKSEPLGNRSQEGEACMELAGHMTTDEKEKKEQLGSCCISHEFYRAASSAPNKIAVIHATGGAFASCLRCSTTVSNKSDNRSWTSTQHLSPNYQSPLLVDDGDECFTYSKLLSAVDSLSIRLCNILNGGDDVCLIRPTNDDHCTEDVYTRSSESIQLDMPSDKFVDQPSNLPKQDKTKVVGVYMVPSVEYIISVLSIMRCGEAFMPIDPVWPEKRIISILSSSNVDLVIWCKRGEWTSFTNQPSEPQWLLKYCRWPHLCLAVDQLSAAKPTQPDMLWPCDSRKSRMFSYLMYTSGSTGQPKGVCGTEKGLLNRFWWLQELHPLRGDERLLFKTSISFVDHIQEFLSAMLTTCVLVIPPSTEVKQNPFSIIDFLEDYTISRLTAVPSLLKAVIPTLRSSNHVQISHSLNLLIVSGELFPVSLWRDLAQILPNTTILNIYGSTEVSGDCMYFDCKRLPSLLDSDSLSSVPIGLPITNCNVKLMKDDVTQNEGEICINGPCLSCGYISGKAIAPFGYVQFAGESQLTNNCLGKYLPMGDFARPLHTGDLVFLGRKDRIIKVNGQRIALEEVEYILRGHPYIVDTAVILINEKVEYTFLRAYVILEQKIDPDSSLKSIRNWMTERLPAAMIPRELICIKELPLSSTGKVNYSSLGDSSNETSCWTECAWYESGEQIDKIKKAFCNVLLAEVGDDDNFFEVGGDSIAAAHVAHELGVDMRQIYKFPTPSKLQSALLEKIAAKKQISEVLPELNKPNRVLDNSDVVGFVNDKTIIMTATKINACSQRPIKRLKMDPHMHFTRGAINLVDIHPWKSNLVTKSCVVARCNRVNFYGNGMEDDYSETWTVNWPQGGRGLMQRLWRINMGSCVDASPVIAFMNEALLFIGAHSHKFLCVNARSGSVKWEATLDGRIECSAVIDGDLSQVIVGCYKGKVHFLNLTTGKLSWTFQTHAETSDQFSPQFSQHKSRIFGCGSHDHNLYALDYRNHCCAYQLPCGGSIFSSPTIDEVNEVLYAATTNGSLTAVSLKASSFNMLWSYNLEAPVFGSLTTSVKGNVICCTVNGDVVAISFRGTLAWKVHIEGPIFAGLCKSNLFPSEAIICSRSGSIYSVDVDKGRILWEHDVGDPITAAAFIDEHVELLHDSAPPGDRLICVCTSSGRVCLFKKSMVTVENQQLGKTDEKFAEMQLEGDIFSSPVMIGGRIFVGCRDDYLHCIAAGISVASYRSL